MQFYILLIKYYFALNGEFHSERVLFVMWPLVIPIPKSQVPTIRHLVGKFDRSKHLPLLVYYPYGCKYKNLFSIKL